MSVRTNFDPVQFANSLINPFGLAISNKQQIIAKTAILGLAVLGLSQALSPSTDNEAKCQRLVCGNNCYLYSLPPFNSFSLFTRCLKSCCPMV